MTLLEFTRGPGFVFSVLVFLLGLGWRLGGIFRRPADVDQSAPRRSDTVAGGLRAVIHRMLPPKAVKVRTVAMANAYAWHLALALVAFGFAPHIMFISRHTGITWPALPAPVVYLAAAVAIVGLLIALLARLTDPVLRLLSGFDDHFSWLVTMAPLATGMALLPMPAQPLWLAVHLLSLELLLVWLPFGKLSHVVLVFVSRYRTGADFTRRGAAV